MDTYMGCRGKVEEVFMIGLRTFHYLLINIDISLQALLSFFLIQTGIVYETSEIQINGRKKGWGKNLNKTKTKNLESQNAEK